jgi:hypothetical protein
VVGESNFKLATVSSRTLNLDFYNDQNCTVARDQRPVHLEYETGVCNALVADDPESFYQRVDVYYAKDESSTTGAGTGTSSSTGNAIPTAVPNAILKVFPTPMLTVLVLVISIWFL